jgi:hypothetical protein
VKSLSIQAVCKVPSPEERYGSMPGTSRSSRRTISPPYWGLPRESHQFALVLADVVIGFVDMVVDDVVTVVVVVVVVEVDVVVGVVAAVGVLPHEASSIAAAINMLKPNHKCLLFICSST